MMLNPAKMPISYRLMLFIPVLIGALFIGIEERPRAALDLVEEVQHMPALRGHKGVRGFVSHRDSSIRVAREAVNGFNSSK